MPPGDTLAPLERWLAQAVAALEPEVRKSLLREIGTELRRRNRARELAQIGPDGTPWRPRKRGADQRIRSHAKMMIGLRALRRMGVKAAADSVEVGWSGRDAAIALVHQDGAVDTVRHNGASVKVKYAARELIGWPQEDLDYVRDRLMAALPR